MARATRQIVLQGIFCLLRRFMRAATECWGIETAGRCSLRTVLMMRPSLRWLASMSKKSTGACDV